MQILIMKIVCVRTIDHRLVGVYGNESLWIRSGRYVAKKEIKTKNVHRLMLHILAFHRIQAWINDALPSPIWLLADGPTRINRQITHRNCSLAGEHVNNHPMLWGPHHPFASPLPFSSPQQIFSPRKCHKQIKFYENSIAARMDSMNQHY
jgi:hypothetical protein